MGTDAFFGPVKATVQAACGQKEDAKKTMENFKEGNPAVLGVRGVYHGVRGRTEKGQKLRERCKVNTVGIVNGVANATPVVGHAKGVYHYARHDKENGDKAMKSASRSTAGFVEAAAGLTAGCGPGAVAGYVAGVTVADGVISAVDSKVQNKMILHGNFATWEEAYKEPSIGNAVEVVIGHGLDVLGGIAVGGGLESALGGDAAANADVSAMSDACAGDAADVSGGADGCGGDASDMTAAGDAPGVDTGKAEVAPKAGENLKFVGDEVKLARDLKAVIVERFGGGGGGGEGASAFDGLSDDLRKIVPEDMKIPEVDLSIGETVADRVDNMTLLTTEDPGNLAKVAVIPDNKRDWIQDVAEAKPVDLSEVNVA
ncbi:unnamed protein product [Scytosiphon promiscuus]